MTGGITLWKDRGYEVEVPKALTKEQRERYSRHLLIPEVGRRGPAEAARRQGAAARRRRPRLARRALPRRRRRRARSASSTTTTVDLSNLQRQVIHTTDRIGVPKVDSAEQTIRALNPDVEVVKYPVRLDASNIMEILPGYDVVVDGLDNFPTRYLLNDASVRLQIPVVCAAILGFEGQLSVFKPYDGPVLPLPVPEPPPAELAPSLRRQRRARRAARDDGPARRRPRWSSSSSARATRWSAACCSTTRWRRASQTRQRAPRPRLPDLLARRPGHLRRGDGRLPRLRGVLRRGRVACAAAPWPPSASHPSCALPSGGEKEVDAPGRLGRRRPALARRAATPTTEGQLFAPDGGLNRYVNVYLNDEDVRVLDGLDTAVSEGDTLVILPAMAGGG